MSTGRSKKYEPNIEFKLYARRWFIMVIFMAFTIISGMQWVEFSIITNVIVKYYNVSPTDVEWTTYIFVVVYVVLGLPSIYILDKFGVRKTIVVAAVGFCVGSWIKVLSVNPNRFHLIMIAQTNQAVWFVMTFGLAARFTAHWFGAHEISIAGSLSLIGDQLGGALAFLIPPLVVKNSSDISVIETGLRRLNWLVAIFSTLVLILVILFFQDKPKTPPSAAQTVQKEIVEKRNENIFKTLIRLLRKPKFLLFAESYALCVGVITPFATLMNQVILINFPNKNEDVGTIGFCNMLSGMASSLIIGFILDKSRLFKEHAIISTVCSFIALVFFTVSLKLNNILYVYIATILLGFVMNGFYPTGVQMCIELTYPISEGVSSSVMFYITQIHTFVISIICSYIFKHYGDVVSNIFICAIVFISTVLSFFLPNKLKRQAVEKSTVKKLNPTEIKELLD